MQKITALCLTVSLILGSSGTAFADRGRHDGYRQHQHNYRQHNDHGYSPSRNWAGPAALLALTGLVIGATAYSQANAAPAYVQRVLRSTTKTGTSAGRVGYWYYCGSAGQYYPYVRYCDEGWQSVMPPRQ